MKLPLKEILTQHLVMLGKTGAGKSSALRYIVEYLIDRKKRVAVVDPKGDWWGLKVSADGKGAGYPVILFGDFKNPDAQDVPINDRSGRHIADLITGGNRPCVIGLRGWTQGAMTRFWIDFAAGLFNANSGELYLVGDEFHNFAPKNWKQQTDKDTPVGIGLHWANRLLSEGRGLGLVCLIASQRPQKVHNDTLTSCETLVAMRVIHAADREADKVWIDGHGDREKGQEVLGSLAGMGRGEAWVWSPEIHFGPTRITFPMFKTFDSFAPPQLQGKVSSKGWADVNLDEVKQALADAVKEAEAKDPKLLQKQIAELRKQLAARTAPGPAGAARAAPVPAGKPVVDDRAIARAVAERDRFWRDSQAALRRKLTSYAGIATRARAMLEQIIPAGGGPEISAPPPPATTAAATSRPAKPKPVPSSSPGDSSLPKGEREVLIACAMHTDGVDRQQITAMTGYKRSTRDTYLHRLRKKDFVEESGQRISATQAGIDALGADFEPLPIGDELRAYWLNDGRLPEGERRVLQAAVEVYPEILARDAISEATGYKRSTRDTYIQRLETRKLIAVARDGIKASDHLFGGG